MPELVLFKNVHIVDYEEERLIHKEITDDLNGYIIRLAEAITSSDRLQFFATEDETKQVISNVKSIIKDILNNTTENIPTKMQSIAKRLLEKEIEAQKQVERLNRKVKKGSLLQSIFYEETKKEFNYLITKTEHTKYMEESKFSVQSGFKIDGQLPTTLKGSGL